MCIGSLTNYLMNIILGAFTSTAVAVYGVYFKIQSFFFMPVFGINNGLIPIIGYNYGARKKERIYRTIRYGVLYACCFMFLGLALFQLIPQVLLGVFSPSEAMLAIGVPALRRISLSFLFAGFCIVAGSTCQALDRSMNSLFVSILRQVVALIPAAWLLSKTGDVNMVWWSFPIAEIMSLLASAFFLRSAIQCSDGDIHFYTMPNRPADAGGLSYTFAEKDEWLALLNEALDPFDVPIGEENLDLVYLENGSFRSTSGTIRGEYYLRR